MILGRVANTDAVVAGQGTVGSEIVRALVDSPRLDAVFVALGGGGLVTGIAAAARESWPE